MKRTKGKRDPSGSSTSEKKPINLIRSPSRFLFNSKRSDLMGVFNKNIQEMEASGMLARRYQHWFGVPQKCDATQSQGEEVLFPVEPFIPLALQTFIMIVVAIFFATFNRLFWGRCRSTSKVTAQPDSQTVDVAVTLNSGKPSVVSSFVVVNDSV